MILFMRNNLFSQAVIANQIYILCIATILVLVGCQVNYLDDVNGVTSTSKDVVPSPTFFNGSIDGKVMTGDGITFLTREGSSFLIRGLWGEPDYYYQVDILVPETTDGTYQLGTNRASGGIGEIIGRDAVGDSYNASGEESDTVAFVWDKDAGRIIGKFEFNAVGDSSDLFVSGEFNVSVSEHGEWTCNFDDEVISRCWFIE